MGFVCFVVSMEQKQEYLELVDNMDMQGWDSAAVSTNIPNHPEIRIPSLDGEYEVEISPVNGYDDGKLHEENLEFYVNVYEYRVENGERIEEEGHIFSRGFGEAKDAVKLAEKKIQELNT